MIEKTFGTILANVEKTINTHGWVYCSNERIKDHKREFSTPFEPLPLVEPVTCMPLEVNEVFIAPIIEKVMQTYNPLHDLPTGQTNDDFKMSLENALPTDIPQLEPNLMSLLELNHKK